MNVAGRTKAITRLAAMPRRTRISLLSCVLALALTGCGSNDDGTIPPDDAENLLNQLAAVEQDVDEGNCDFAQQHAQEFVSSVGALPNDVDPKVEQELASAASRLDELASDPSECTETGTSGLTGDQPTTSTTETVTPETTTEETSTTTEETTTEEPAEEQPSEDPNQQPPTGGDQGGNTGGSGAPPSGGVTGGGSAG
jgi:hypothetical protein